MNDQPGNVITQFFAWVAAVASAAGIATQDMIYIFFGAVGAAVSVFSFVSGRVDAYRSRKEEERRTQLFADYIKTAAQNPEAESPASVVEVMKRISE
ncbi:hypothetical protein [Pectobacterium carotovorum]|uniref:hypothetical protein n=1 Tax=Pectobacterium carotovorum TaxID=554 RepID=UPI000D7373F8|nr:hypothetical protein [Pectobacterium carotovorum]PXB01138.1 hypothetical protein DMB41_16190 [Pectobacterium carotovorum subsp. carotovorum]